MTTTIQTASKKLFERICEFLRSKKVSFTSELLTDAFSLTIFNLATAQTDALIQEMPRHLHFLPKSQQGAQAPAA